MRTCILGLAFGLFLGGGSRAQGPDVSALDVGNTVAYWGSSGGIAAYNFTVRTCNAGDEPLAFSGLTHDHPVLGENLFRLKDGRFQQLGQSWLKHEVCALNETGCGTCVPTACATLGVGCATSSSIGLHDGHFGGPKLDVDASGGSHPAPTLSPVGDDTIRGRLQVHLEDVDPALNAGASYFFEGQYVSEDDALSGNGLDNASWRPVNVLSVSNIDATGTTHRGEPAIFAWQDADPSVTLASADVLDEGGPGAHGRFWVGVSVTQTSPGSWHYEYAVQNLTSSRAAGSLSIPMSADVVVANVEFVDVDYHSGEPFSGTDWETTRTASALVFSTDDFATDANANALRWGTLYDFAFDANAPPVPVDVVLGLFEPGVPASISASVRGPGAAAEPGLRTCFGSGCPCGNDSTSTGCANSTGGGAALSGAGSTSVALDDLVLTTTSAPPNNSGLYFMGAATFAPVFVGDGLACTGGVFRYFPGVVDGAGTFTQSGLVAGAFPGAISPGDTRYFQSWTRDVLCGPPPAPCPSPCGQGSNLSNAYGVQFVP